MKKKVVMMLCAAMLMGTINGCGVMGTIVVDENGKITEESATYYNEKEYADTQKKLGASFDEKDYQKVEIDGKVFYKDLTGTTTSTMRGISATEIYSPMGLDSDEEKAQFEQMKALFDFYTMTITLPEPIVRTNGELSEDGKTVTFYPLELAEKGESVVYAYTESSKGVLYLDADKYIKETEIKIVSDSEIQSLQVNGKDINVNNTIATTKEGKYKITVSNETDTKTFTVIKDTKAPTIKGAKDGKSYKKAVTLTFSDKDKIANVLHNDKKVKLSSMKKKDGAYTLKIKKKGFHSLTVKDAAGNEKSIWFMIQ